MINFTPDMLTKVLDGSKTRTWRPLKDGETVEYLDRFMIGVGAVYHPSGRLKWRVGYDYKVGQGRGWPAVWVDGAGNAVYTPDGLYVSLTQGGGKPITFVVHSLTRCQPSQTKDFEARQEGFESVEGFHAKLRKLYTNFDLDTWGVAITWGALTGIKP